MEVQVDKRVGPAIAPSLTCAAGRLQRWRAPASRNVAGEGSWSKAIETKDCGTPTLEMPQALKKQLDDAKLLKAAKA